MTNCLKARFPLLLSLLPLLPVLGQDAVTVTADSAVGYILSCRKSNGAFGPIDQHYTDAAWNYPAVAALKLLGEEIENPGAILENGLGYPKGHVGYGHWQFFHVHGIRELLGAPIAPDHETVRLQWQDSEEIRYYGSPFGTDGDVFFNAGGRPNPDPRDIGAKELGFYNLSSLYYLVEGLRASGREHRRSEAGSSRTVVSQAKDGGFVDVRDQSKLTAPRDSHVAHTLFAVSLLASDQFSLPWENQNCIRFLENCQDESGGFRFHPSRSIAGNLPDLYYTWCAVRALDVLGSEPRSPDACIAWINSLQNADGGFGDRPGWRSRLYSTFYAVDALAILTGGKPGSAIAEKRRRQKKVDPIPEGRFGIYQGLSKMPVISPDDLAGLHARGFNLLALKSDDFALAGALRTAIREKQFPMDVVLCPEAYPHRSRRSGGAVLHHICNPILDPEWGPGKRGRWTAADAAGAGGLPWKDYREKVIGELRVLGSTVYPEQDFEMEFAYSAYDAGLEGVAGYNAILAGFNWAPHDFVRVFPWRERYVDKLIPIADCDAHGDLEKWSPQLDHVRHLFLAEGPDYEYFCEAARAGWVVCVIRNTEEGAPPATFYGRKVAVEYVKERMDEWKWWE